MATIKEIAEKSGFSPATVSRLLNNDPHLSITPATRKRIMTVANELGYWADHRKQDTIRPTIALLYRVDSKEQLQDEYFSSLKDELLKVIEAAGLQVQVFEHISDLVAKADAFQGFIGVGPHRLTRQKLMALHDVLPNGVFVDINPAPELFDSVRPNLTLTIRDAIQRLIAAGAHRIGFIGGVGLNLIGFSSPISGRRPSGSSPASPPGSTRRRCLSVGPSTLRTVMPWENEPWPNAATNCRTPSSWPPIP